MAQRSKGTRLSNIWKRIFGTRFRSYLLDQKYRINPAFTHDGVDYYEFANQEDVPSGRGFAALGIYNEMDMRVTREYLELHCKAMEKILSDPKKIHIGYISQINANLRERLDLMVLPDFIYKLASVIYFDKSESEYSYDYVYNEAKIKRWKKDPKMLDFFLQRRLTELVPFLTAQEGNLSTYSAVAEMVAEIHHKHLTGILSEETSTTG